MSLPAANAHKAFSAASWQPHIHTLTTVDMKKHQSHDKLHIPRALPTKSESNRNLFCDPFLSHTPDTSGRMTELASLLALAQPAAYLCERLRMRSVMCRAVEVRTGSGRAVVGSLVLRLSGGSSIHRETSRAGTSPSSGFLCGVIRSSQTLLTARATKSGGEVGCVCVCVRVCVWGGC